MIRTASICDTRCQIPFTILWVAALSILMAGGCNKNPSKQLPVTFSVTGEVVDENGKPVNGGSLEFRSHVNIEMRAMSEVRDDGTFTLYTLLVDGDKVTGAVEGPYTATFFPYSQTHSISTTPIRLKKKFTVEPKVNHFSVSLPNGS